jgi:hypothetical protein
LKIQSSFCVDKLGRVSCSQSLFFWVVFCR